MKGWNSSSLHRTMRSATSIVWEIDFMTMSGNWVSQFGSIRLFPNMDVLNHTTAVTGNSVPSMAKLGQGGPVTPARITSLERRTREQRITSRTHLKEMLTEEWTWNPAKDHPKTDSAGTNTTLPPGIMLTKSVGLSSCSECPLRSHDRSSQTSSSGAHNRINHVFHHLRLYIPSGRFLSEFTSDFDDSGVQG